MCLYLYWSYGVLFWCIKMKHSSFLCVKSTCVRKFFPYNERHTDEIAGTNEARIAELLGFIEVQLLALTRC